MGKQRYNGAEGSESLLSEKKEGKKLAKRSTNETMNANIDSIAGAGAGAYAMGTTGLLYGGLFGGPIGAAIGLGVGITSGTIGGAITGSISSSQMNDLKKDSTVKLIQAIGTAVVDNSQEQLREGIKSQAKVISKRNPTIERSIKAKESKASEAFFDAAIDLATKKINSGEEQEWKAIEKQLTNALDNKDLNKGFKIAAEALEIQCQIAGVKYDDNIKNFGLTDQQVSARNRPSIAESIGSFFNASEPNAPENYKTVNKKNEAKSVPAKESYQPPKMPDSKLPAQQSSEDGFAQKFVSRADKQNGYSDAENSRKQLSETRYLS
jgi:hypothetical protein